VTRTQLVAAALFVFLLRLGLIGVGAAARGGATPTNGDEPVYHGAALQLAHDPAAWVQRGTEFGYRAPLAFVYLAGIYRIVPSPGFITGQAATSALGALVCVLLYFLVRRVAGEGAAVAAFWIRGLLPAFVVPDTFVLSEPLFAACLVGAWLVALRMHASMRRSDAALLGALVACCVLTREAAMTFPLLFAGFIWITRESATRAAARLALFGAAFLLTLAPWLLRNTQVWGTPLPLSYTAGVNLYIGNNPTATGGWKEPDRAGRPADVRFGTPAYDRWYRQQAVAFVREHPGRVVSLGFKKIAWLLWPRFARDDIKGLYPLGDEATTRISMVVGASSAALMLGALLRLAFARRDPFWWLTISFAAATAITTFISIGDPRFRDGLDHLLLAQCAIAVSAVPSLVRDGRVRLVHTPRVAFGFVATLAAILTCWAWAGSQLSIR